MKGCLQRLVGMVIFAVICISAIVYFAVNHKSKLPAEVKSTPAPLPNPPEKKVEPATNQTFNVAPIAISSADAHKLVNDSIQNCLKKLSEEPTYKKAVAAEVLALRILKEYRKDIPGTQAFLDASSNHVNAVKKLKSIEADAITNDNSVNRAKLILAESLQIEKEAEDERLRKIADKNAREQAERERIYNLPVNKAIREHRLIEGMTSYEAVQSLGKPYSITRSGRYAVVMWQIGNEYWGGTFIDDSLNTISHSIY